MKSNGKLAKREQAHSYAMTACRRGTWHWPARGCMLSTPPPAPSLPPWFQTAAGWIEVTLHLVTVMFGAGVLVSTACATMTCMHSTTGCRASPQHRLLCHHALPSSHLPPRLPVAGPALRHGLTRLGAGPVHAGAGHWRLRLLCFPAGRGASTVGSHSSSLHAPPARACA